MALIFQSLEREGGRERNRGERRRGREREGKVVRNGGEGKIEREEERERMGDRGYIT